MTSNHLLLYRLAELMLEHEQHILPVDLLFDDEQIGDFVKSIQIDSPYQQMFLDGVLTESVRDEKLYVSFTVEGYFHYLLGEVISNLMSNNNAKYLFQKTINSQLVGAKSGLEQYFIKCARTGEDSIIYDFIDLHPDSLSLIVKPLASLIVFNKHQFVLDNLFKEYSENDINVLIEVLEYLYKKIPAAHIKLQNELLKYKFLTQIDKFKKSYIEALNNSFIESIDIDVIDDISSNDTKLEFTINLEKIKLYRKLNQPQLAENFISRNLELISSLESIGEREALKLFYDNISFYYAESGKYSIALESSQKALSFSDENQSDYGVLLNNLALRFIDLRIFNEAQSYLELAILADLKMYGQYSRNVASRYGNFGLLHLEMSKYDEAITCLRMAIEIDIKLLGNQHAIIATRLVNLAEALRHENQVEDALRCVFEAREIDIANYGSTHPMIAYSYNIESHIYSQIGDFEKAIQTISKAIEINKLFNNGINDRLNRDLNYLGVTFAKSGKYNEALQSFLEANCIEEELFANNPELRIITWLNICKVYFKMGDRHNLMIYLDRINTLPEIVRNDYSSYIQDLSKNDL
jgi:tetratricopeptide (TPR) repeat protein